MKNSRGAGGGTTPLTLPQKNLIKFRSLDIVVVQDATLDLFVKLQETKLSGLLGPLCLIQLDAFNLPNSYQIRQDSQDRCMLHLRNTHMIPYVHSLFFLSPVKTSGFSLRISGGPVSRRRSHIGAEIAFIMSRTYTGRLGPSQQPSLCSSFRRFRAYRQKLTGMPIFALHVCTLPPAAVILRIKTFYLDLSGLLQSMCSADLGQLLVISLSNQAAFRIRGNTLEAHFLSQLNESTTSFGCILITDCFQ